MLRRIGLWLLFVVLAGTLAAQSDAGKIKGIVTDENGPVEYATVVIIQNGVIKGGGTTNEMGEYSIAPVSPGVYEVKASYAGNNSVVTGVDVAANKTVAVDVNLSTGVEMKTVEIFETIQIDQTTQGGALSSEQIQQSGIRNVNTLAAMVPGVYQSDDGGSLSMRGGRSSGTTYFIDGVKVRGVTTLPQKAIGQLTVITGGTPAEYGDMIGGVISITTASPSYQFTGGGELITSKFLDPYGYNLIGLNASGPIISKYIDSMDYNKPILGFFVAGEGEFMKDADPAFGGVAKLKDEYYQDYQQNPLQLDPSGNFFYSRGNFITPDQVERSKFKLNNRDDRYRITMRLDFAPTDNITVKFGGNYELIGSNTYGIGGSLWAPEGNQRFDGSLIRGWARFQQTFKTTENAKVKNLFYMLQADYQSYQREFTNENHGKNLFDYGFVGNFNYDLREVYRYLEPGSDGHNQDISSDGYYYTAGFSPRNLTFDPTNSKEPLMANYNNFIFDYVQNQGIVNPFTGVRDNSISSLDFLAFYGGLRNGDSPDGIYSLYSGPGTSPGGYSKFQYEQYRLTGQVSGEIGGHNLKAGFEFEQRQERFYSVNARGLWFYMRLLANRHLATINSDPSSWQLVMVDGQFQDTVHAPRAYVAESQSVFDKNLRAKLGLAENGTDYIITDNLAPSTYDLGMFSADELLNNGSYVVSYYGYDYVGQRAKPVSADKFFTDLQNRPMNAFAPTYISGFVQDKFELEDIIFNIGVRVDRFDANQKVLKDNYLLFPTYNAAEANAMLGTEKPDGVGDDWVPYTDNASNPTAILGYRDGRVWYDANGSPTNPANLRVGGKVQPFIKDDEVSIQSFADYVPQTIVMPRLSFSFPISDVAVFFAHYDVLAQRPGQIAPTSGSLLAGQIADFAFLQNSATVSVTNPNLKPERTIDYEVGFKQKLNDYLALSVSAFYREMRDMIQTVNFQDAYPISYSSYDNLDFGTVKGFSFSLNMIRMGNIRFNASYTLQFANGTGSSFSSSRNASNSTEGFTTIRSLLPLDFDQRHRFTGNFDYRFYDDNTKGPGINIGGKTIYPLANAGANVTFYLGSGTPYSTNILADASAVIGGINSSIQLGGTPNGSRLPWQARFDLRIDKDFLVGGGDKTDASGSVIKDSHGTPIKKREYSFNVYMLFLNALNTKNILNVYKTSGRPDDDGYLNSGQGAQSIAAAIDGDAFTYLYTLKMQNPDNYSTPRRIRLGLIFSF